MEFRVIWLGHHALRTQNGHVMPGEVANLSDSFVIERVRLIAAKRLLTREQYRKRLLKMDWDQIRHHVARVRGLPGNGSKSELINRCLRAFDEPTAGSQEEE